MDKNALIQEVVNYFQEKINSNELTIHDIFYGPDSLRLRMFGNKLLKMYFENHTFPLERRLTMGELITLSKKINTPYYITDKNITIYDDEQIMILKLSQGKIIRWLSRLNKKT